MIERFILRHMYGREEVLQLLITFAIFMILEDVQRLIWGVQPYFDATPLQLLSNVSLFGIYYTSYQIILLPVAALLMLFGLRFFLRRTMTGKVITAVTEDWEMATAIGINAERVYLITFVLGAGFAGLGGALASPTTSLIPGMGAEMIVLSFAVVATAGRWCSTLSSRSSSTSQEAATGCACPGRRFSAWTWTGQPSRPFCST